MSAAPELVLDVHQLSLVFPGTGVPVLHNVDLRIGRGESVGLVGESGSGKTTLARAVLGLAKPTSGAIRLFGESAAESGRRARKALRKRAQMVFQDPYSSLNPSMSVLAAVIEPMIVHDIGDPTTRPARAAALLDRVGIERALARRYPAQLSGGQRQRVAIARALACEPELLICDEAVSALDVSVQAQILNLFKSLRLELGLSLLFVTHDLAVVRFIANRIAVMQAGRIVEEGSKAAIFDAPRHPYTRELLAASAMRGALPETDRPPPP